MKDVKCNGFRYNFKKGSELCPRRVECSRYNNMEGDWYLMKTLKFDTQKEFRNCKHFIKKSEQQL